MKSRDQSESVYAPRIIRIWIAVLVCAMGFRTVGCGKKAEGSAKAESGEHGKEDGHGHEEGGGAAVAFKPGRGLQLSPEIIRALELKTVDAAERPLISETKIVAQVFSLKPQVLASASVPESEAKHIEKHTFKGAKIARIEQATIRANRLTEVVFAIDKTPPPQLGEFVTLEVGSETTNALAVPTSALLEGATGNYVYVVNGQFYLRTPVKVGVRAGDFVEITDGLYAGDSVVAAPVNQLWLAELRLTKGGGHSH